MIFNPEILPHDYCIYRKDRNTRGGGVLFAVHKSIPSRLLDSPTDLELIAIHLQDFICVVYIPPSIEEQPFLNTLSFLKNLVTSGPILIMGDFNRPDINWLSLTSSSTLSDIFCDFVFDNI